MVECPTCRLWHDAPGGHAPAHRCPPAWHCYTHERRGVVVYASDPQDAATEAAERWDQDDAETADEREASVRRADEPAGRERVYLVRAEVTVEYRAEELPRVTN